MFSVSRNIFNISTGVLASRIYSFIVLAITTHACSSVQPASFVCGKIFGSPRTKAEGGKETETTNIICAKHEKK